MRNTKVRSAKPVGGGLLPASDDDEKAWYRREWRLITLLVIMIVAFVIRFIFAYGVSAGSDFALSGGTGAASHAHTIESILNGSFSFTDPALNYPYGSVNIYPIFMDVIMAGVAGIVSLFGVSIGTAVAGTLAFSAPILAALTCWPVYLIGRKMFNDEKIGLLAALLYAFFALLIMSTAFSNGTEYALVGFLFAFMMYFLLKAMEICDDDEPEGIRAMFGNRSLLKNVLGAAILFTLIVLTWNQFRIIVLMFVVLMVVQALVDRLRSKSVMPAVAIYSCILLVGMLISLPYYLVAGLWDLVYSGAFVVAILSVAMALFFALTQKKTWVIMIPVTVVISVVILAVIYFVSGDLYSATMGGNNIYTNPLMASIANSTSITSMSSMAAYYGWVTLWLPFVLFLYMFYKYRSHLDSKKYTFTMWWVIIMFVIGWYSSSYAFLAGAGFAVASSMMILMVIRSAGVKSYFTDMRGNGFRIPVKKLLKPIPLVAFVALIALIAVPNFVFALDASTPTNAEDSNYFGGLGYTIMTDDVNTINTMWSEMSDTEKAGALVPWFGYSVNAVSSGGFDSVTDTFGGGASAMSALLLANSSAAATATMAIRLLLSKDLSQYQTVINNAGLDYNLIKGYIDNPSTAVQEVKDNISDYSGIDPSVTEENALYLVLSHYITTTISEPRVDDLYDNICAISQESINYVAVDVSMLPLYYNDRSYFSTVAYLGGYSIGSYGAPTQFFSYDTSSGYATYTDALYSTFFWKALIGMSPTEAGYSSSTDYLNALALSTGSVKADPGYGLANYKVAYWYVYYNPDSSATTSSSGWVSMDAYQAIAKQNTDGGVINYVNGVVMLEYDSSLTTEVSGTVSYNSASGITGAGGIQASVFVKTDYDSTGVTGYVKRSTVLTNPDGSYTVSVPVGADYYVVFSSGTNTLDTGSVIKTVWNMTDANSSFTIPTTSLSGTVYVNADPFQPYTQNCYVTISGLATGTYREANVVGGNFSFNNLIPDVYTLTVFSPNGTTINTGTVTVTAGDISGYRISATSGTLTVTATTDVGANAPDGTTIVAKDTSTGATYTGSVVSGKATIYVVPSTYTVYATGNKVSVSNPSSTVSSGGSSTASLTVFNVRNISVSGAPAGSLVTIMSYGFITSSTSSTFAIPVSGGSTNEIYTAYAVSGGNVYYGTTTGNSISLVSSAGYSVSGLVKDSNGNIFTGTVSFIKQDGAQAGATFVFTTDDTGNFNVTLPAGTYTMYIYGSGAGASLSTITVSADTQLPDITLSASRDLTLTLNYRTNMSSSTTRGIGFVDVILTLTIDDTNYSITAKTDSTGKVVFTIPQGYAAIATANAITSASSPFYMATQTNNFSSGNSNTSYTWTLAASSDSDATKYVKTVNVSNSVSVSLTLYNSSTTTYQGTNLSNVIPGQYTAVIDGSSGYYFNGTIYIYPGQSGPLNIQATNVVKVDLNASSDDTITVTPTDTDKGNYFVDPNNSLTYYLERGKSFFFTAMSSDGTQIAYASVSNITSSTTLNLNNKADTASIDGYAGVTADGTVTVSYGTVKITFPISSGAFTITVPSGTAIQLDATMTQTIGNNTYTYTGSTSMPAGDVVDGAKIRFHSVTTSVTGILDGVMSGSNFSFVNGVGSFTLSVKNTDSFDNTYTITAGSSWVLDQAYTLKVASGQTGTITISGRYNPSLVGAGDPNLSVTVTSINGTAAGTYVIAGTAFPSTGVTTSDLFVDLTGTDGATADAVNGYEYMYAVTLTNNDSYLKTVSVSLQQPLPSGWSVAFSDKDGGNIYAYGTTNSFTVNGFSSTVVYIKVMYKDGSQTAVPSIDVKVTTTQGQLNTKTSQVNIQGSSATFSMDAQSASMEAQGMSATGDNIFNSATPAPASTIILLALCIVGFIAMVWMGAKKGVLVRRR